MSEIGKKRINTDEQGITKKAKKNRSRKQEIVDFDSINKVILDAYPKLDTKNLELIKFLTIFDILFEKANRNNQASEFKEQLELDSVDGLPEIIKIVCKTLLTILSESLHEVKLPLNIKKILIKLKKLLKITENGDDKISKKTSSSSSSSSRSPSESASESAPITFSNRSEKTSPSSEKTTLSSEQTRSRD